MIAPASQSGAGGSKATQPWARVPLAVMEDKRVSLEARLVLAYLHSLAVRPGWEIRIDGHVLPTLGISASRWPRLRRELEAYGYYHLTRMRGPNGRLRQVHTINIEPAHAETAGQAHRRSSTPANPRGGDSTPRAREALQRADIQHRASSTYVDARSITVSAAIEDSDRSAPPNPDSAPAAKSSRPYRTRGSIRGVQVWTDGDRFEVAGMVDQYGANAVEDAASRIVARGQKPLPSCVRAELRSTRAATERSASRGDTGALAELRARDAARATREADPEIAARSAAIAGSELTKMLRILDAPSPTLSWSTVDG